MFRTGRVVVVRECPSTVRLPTCNSDTKQGYRNQDSRSTVPCASSSLVSFSDGGQTVDRVQPFESGITPVTKQPGRTVLAADAFNPLHSRVNSSRPTVSAKVHEAGTPDLPCPRSRLAQCFRKVRREVDRIEVGPAPCPQATIVRHADHSAHSPDRQRFAGSVGRKVRSNQQSISNLRVVLRKRARGRTQDLATSNKSGLRKNRVPWVVAVLAGGVQVLGALQDQKCRGKGLVIESWNKSRYRRQNDSIGRRCPAAKSSGGGEHPLPRNDHSFADGCCAFIATQLVRRHGPPVSPFAASRYRTTSEPGRPSARPGGQVHLTR